MLVRVPIDHHNLYERMAEEPGIPLGSWVTMQLAELYDLPIPEYIHEELAAAEQRRRADESRQELPMPRTA